MSSGLGGHKARTKMDVLKKYIQRRDAEHTLLSSVPSALPSLLPFHASLRMRPPQLLVTFKYNIYRTNNSRVLLFRLVLCYSLCQLVRGPDGAPGFRPARYPVGLHPLPGLSDSHIASIDSFWNNPPERDSCLPRHMDRFL